uniref:Uncharacterized protein n=1 Tax=Arsenophonus nasoniae TaxID=638 RepID=D2U2U3_9GAMM|nr:hypothetical protein ARN_29230 [Arsenophonus nasoniae]
MLILTCLANTFILLLPAKANDEKIVIVNLLILRWLAGGFGIIRYFPCGKRFTTL